MKNLIYYTIIFSSLTTIGIVGYLTYQKITAPKIYDTSTLSTISVDGKNYKTTGAIPTQDEARQELMNQTIRLATTTNADSSLFLISISQYGDINVKLYKPYDVNKEKFFAWLDDNGYDKIDRTKIVFEEIK